jgi:hypothetical protein
MNAKHISTYLPDAMVAERHGVRAFVRGDQVAEPIFRVTPTAARASIGDRRTLQRFERGRIARDTAGARRAARLGAEANHQNRVVTSDS